jgi:integrase/recombinase XerD
LPTSRNIKKALPMEDVAKIYNYEPTCNQEKWAKDIWLFSYFGNGINTKDIIHLKWKNIDEEFIVFVRAKTDTATRENTIPISIFINEDMKRILTYWATEQNEPDDYIFPVLRKGMSPLVQYEQLGLFIRSVNDWMAKIKTKLGIKRNVTTYVARHTFSTVLKKAGVSTEFIREALGHTSIQTTENYLDSFEKEMKKEYASKLLDFK